MKTKRSLLVIGICVSFVIISFLSAIISTILCAIGQWQWIITLIASIPCSVFWTWRVVDEVRE